MRHAVHRKSGITQVCHELALEPVHWLKQQLWKLHLLMAAFLRVQTGARQNLCKPIATDLKE